MRRKVVRKEGEIILGVDSYGPNVMSTCTEIPL